MAAEPEGEVVFRDGRLVITADRNAPPPMPGYVVPGGNPLAAKPKRNPTITFAPEDGLQSFDRSKATPEMTRRAYELAQELVESKEYTEEERQAGAVAADSTVFYMKALAGLLDEATAPPVPEPAKPKMPSARPAPTAPPAAAAEDFSPYNLDIPDLYATPTKPEELVVFELPGFGKHKARYHWVLVVERLLVLVFDTRYDGAEPYIPAVPADGKSFRLGLHAAQGHEEEAYYVQPVGTTIPFGCFSLILFVIDAVTDNASTFAGFEPE